jgi:hypothetical protein
MDDGHLRVDPWVISYALPESEDEGGGPRPGERHSDYNQIR